MLAHREAAGHIQLPAAFQTCSETKVLMPPAAMPYNTMPVQTAAVESALPQYRLLVTQCPLGLEFRHWAYTLLTKKQ